ncbi:MAG TPA: hypothetical protein VK589_11835 [Chryseolinea sp.]|nr:hypothetical protein [Chryseolinea sp.]
MIKQKQTRVQLFGSKTDPEVKASIEKIKRTGRKVELTPAPSHDTNLGMCGKKLCHCKHVCAMAYPGDTGASMGMSY